MGCPDGQHNQQGFRSTAVTAKVASVHHVVRLSVIFAGGEAQAGQVVARDLLEGQGVVFRLRCLGPVVVVALGERRGHGVWLLVRVVGLVLVTGAAAQQ